MEAYPKICLRILAALMMISASLAAQTPTQTIRGIVLDKDTKQPLIGATIQIMDLDASMGVITDLDGGFVIPGIPVGRHRLECQYIGYNPFVSDNIILNSAKELNLVIELVETGVQMEEVVVRARKLGNEPLNELAIVSTRSFSVEETQRYAASGNDPTRMAIGFPGVQASRDNRSDIVIRGNASFGLLWRLEGVDILNPNHFARKGSSGGGITIFSVSMLSNSDFSTGAFPADYGNAFSGIFDMKFRIGNKQKREYTFRAGMLGLDFSTEGPIKEGRSSYLFNYRYSTLGILDAFDIRLVDERESNRFQDLSFKLHFNSEDYKHTLSVWGIGGLSDEFFEAVDGTENWQSYTDYQTRDFDTDMGALGMNYTYLINEKSYLAANVALMGQKVIFRNDTLNTSLSPTVVNDEDYRQNRLVLNGYYSHKFNNQLALRAGLIATHINYDLFWSYLVESTNQIFLLESGNTTQWQTYGTLRWQPNPLWHVNMGIHAMYFALNETYSVQPRLGIRFQSTPTSSFSLAYGSHSRTLPLGSYFTRGRISGEQRYPNLRLDLLKAHHLVFGVEKILAEKFRLRLEAYWQHLYDVPVSADPASTFSIINMIEGYARRPLVSEGTGRNMGIDLTLEKMFSQGSFFIASASIFDSSYEPLNGERYSTNYDSEYALAFMGGKEWELAAGKTLQTGLRVLYNGGQRLTPILSPERDPYYPASPILDESRPFSEQVDPYFRPDIRIAFRRDKPGVAWTLALDIQNAISYANIDALDRDFDPDLGQWVYREQSSLVPVLSYQIDF